MNYTENDIITLLKEFYPHEWKSVEIKFLYYQKKDKYIARRFGKARYNMPKPEKLIQSVSLYKNIMTSNAQKKHADNFNEEDIKKAKDDLWRKREPKIKKVNHKIERAILKTQQVTPAYIDQIIGLYNQKNTTQKDKMYILAGLKKYYSTPIIDFFFKINDTELNTQLRLIAFKHLQSFNYQPRLRRQKYMQVHCKNKKRKKYLKEEYARAKYEIPENPDELEYRIQNAKDEQLKEFDYFISHSSKDSSAVQKLILFENLQGKNVFCDWINDVDYLKRHLVCEATLAVLEKRMEQSEKLIFVISQNSMNSIWCKYELNYYHELGKQIYTIEKSDIESKTFNIKLLKDYWFLDSDYKELALFEGEKIQG